MNQTVVNGTVFFPKKRENNLLQGCLKMSFQIHHFHGKNAGVLKREVNRRYSHFVNFHATFLGVPPLLQDPVDTEKKETTGGNGRTPDTFCKGVQRCLFQSFQIHHFHRKNVGVLK